MNSTMTLAVRTRSLIVAVITLLIGFQSAAVFAQGSVEERLRRIERRLDSGTLIQLYDGIEQLKREIRGLRGEIEVQNGKLRKLESKQKRLFDSLDKRMTALESGGGGNTASSAPQGSNSGSDQSSTDSARAIAADVAEEGDYQAAFDLLKAQQYDKAGRAFKKFLAKYPGGSYADNAQYWLGETHYVGGNYKAALSSFRTLIKKYPQSSKVKDAWLKTGFAHERTGNLSKAKQALRRVVKGFPDSTAAGLARKRLKSLGG